MARLNCIKISTVICGVVWYNKEIYFMNLHWNLLSWAQWNWLDYRCRGSDDHYNDGLQVLISSSRLSRVRSHITLRILRIV